MMRVRFSGDENDPVTKEIGIVKHGEYNASLERAGLFARLFLGWQLILKVSVRGRQFSIPYGSMRAFDLNWNIK